MSRRTLQDDLRTSAANIETKLMELPSKHTDAQTMAFAKMSVIGTLNTVLLLALFLCVVVMRHF